MKTQLPWAKWVVALLLVLIVVGLAVLWSARRPQLSDQDQLVQLVAQAQEAAEKRDATALARLVSDSYRDKDNNDKHQITRLIVAWMRSAPAFTVVPSITGTSIQGDTARVQLQVRYWISEQPTGEGDDFPMILSLRKEGQDWKITSAEGWQQEQSNLMGGE